MNTPYVDLPQPKITKPLSFRPVQRSEKEQQRKNHQQTKNTYK